MSDNAIGPSTNHASIMFTSARIVPFDPHIQFGGLFGGGDGTDIADRTEESVGISQAGLMRDQIRWNCVVGVGVVVTTDSLGIRCRGRRRGGHGCVLGRFEWSEKLAAETNEDPSIESRCNEIENVFPSPVGPQRGRISFRRGSVSFIISCRHDLSYRRAFNQKTSIASMSSTGESTKKRSAAEEGGAGNEAAAKRSREDEVDERKVPAIKQEETGALKQETDDEKNEFIKEETDDEEEAEEKTVLVEFKFRNSQTSLLYEGEWEGTIVVPMLQDARTGLYRLPPTEEIKFQGTRSMFEVWKSEVTGDELKLLWKDNGRFEGCFRRRDGPGSELAYLDLGLDVGVCWDSDDRPEPEKAVSKRGKLQEVCERTEQKLRTPACPLDTTNAPSADVAAEQLQEWERNQGGMLSAWAKVSIAKSFEDKDNEWMKHPKFKETGTYKMKLYTVLSVQRPDARTNHQPDWAALEKIVLARFPDKNAVWAKRAVKQYRLFLELKIAANDFVSDIYTQIYWPSRPIDEIWQAHISHLDVYQQDILSLTDGLHIIERLPVYDEAARAQYENAYNDHIKRIKSLRGSRWLPRHEVDNEFWPDPSKLEDIGEPSDGDSYDGVATGYRTRLKFGIGGVARYVPYP